MHGHAACELLLPCQSYKPLSRPEPNTCIPLCALCPRAARPAPRAFLNYMQDRACTVQRKLRHEVVAGAHVQRTLLRKAWQPWVAARQRFSKATKLRSWHKTDLTQRTAQHWSAQSRLRRLAKTQDATARMHVATRTRKAAFSGWRAMVCRGKTELEHSGRGGRGGQGVRSIERGSSRQSRSGMCCWQLRSNDGRAWLLQAGALHPDTEIHIISANGLTQQSTSCRANSKWPCKEQSVVVNHALEAI
jgi:hypothetical protein